MKNFLILIFILPLILLASAAHADVNFDKMLKILSNTKQIADCQIEFSGRESGLYELGVTKQSKTVSFMLTSPERTGGRIVVRFDSAERTYTYSESDIVGWTHLSIKLGSDGTPVALAMTKTLPNGRVYETGVDCR